jgi:hypothetical protein
VLAEVESWADEFERLVGRIGPRFAPRAPAAAAQPPSPNGSSQNQDEQAQSDPSEAPGFATGSGAGVRARNSATNSPPKRAHLSLGWDHAASGQGSTL